MATIKLRSGETWQEILTLRGATGETGATGADGAAGVSAYASAQLGGYSGSEADFYGDLAAVEGLLAELEAL